MKRCLLVVTEPVRFAQLEKSAEGINVTLAAFNVLLIVLASMYSLSDRSLIDRVLGWGISIILFMIYSWILVRIGKGRVQVYEMINMTLYIHISYILINSLVGNKGLHLGVYILGHIYAILLQIVLFKHLFRCQLERVRLIFYVEVGIIIIGFLNQMMIYLGEQILYTSKILHFQLLG